MALSRKVGWGSDEDEHYKGLQLQAVYEYPFTVNFSMYHPTVAGIRLKITSEDVDFWWMLNQSLPDSHSTDFAGRHVFPNVWDRKTLFLHASFVTDTTAGYLGRGGEFYPKPSKMYRHGNWNDFFVEVSLDGYHKVPMLYENWILELVLILDADEYQSP
jgi:hypothetical protein